jgi:hypothetical protein
MTFPVTKSDLSILRQQNKGRPNALHWLLGTQLQVIYRRAAEIAIAIFKSCACLNLRFAATHRPAPS